MQRALDPTRVVATQRGAHADEQLPRVPGYRLVRPLGEGGMAAVYLAVHERLQREVALKIMSPALERDDSFRAAFVEEGRIVARLDHPNIVTVYDITEAGGLLCMAMQYASGGTLRQRISDGMRPEAALGVTRAVAQALGYAHANGYIHRDVKPPNVLFKDGEVPVLSDFGIAKALDTKSDFTLQGVNVGTPHYMSPEQVKGSALDGRADLYSLGIVLYEMLTRRRPYSAGDSMSIAAQQVTEPPPTLPESLSRYQPLLDRLLAKKPDDRFQDAAALIQAIDALAPAPAPRSLGLARMPRGALLRAAAGVGVVALLLAGGNALRPLDAPTPRSAVKLSDEQAKTVRDMLEVAEVHELVGRLYSPPHGNALASYRMVLDIDPSNPRARRAVERLEAGRPRD